MAKYKVRVTKEYEIDANDPVTALQTVNSNPFGYGFNPKVVAATVVAIEEKKVEVEVPS